MFDFVHKILTKSNPSRPRETIAASLQSILFSWIFFLSFQADCFSLICVFLLKLQLKLLLCM